MEMKGWGDLDTRQWWIGVIVIAGPCLVAALSTGRDNAAIIAAGVVVWAFGEWVQHPFQQSQRGGYVVSSYKRHLNLFGTVLNLIGVGLIIFGAYRYWGH